MKYLGGDISFFIWNILFKFMKYIPTLDILGIVYYIKIFNDIGIVIKDFN